MTSGTSAATAICHCTTKRYPRLTTGSATAVTTSWIVWPTSWCSATTSFSTSLRTVPDERDATTATTTVTHIRPASTSPPDNAGSRVRASSTIATNGTTLLSAPTTLSPAIVARLPFTGPKKVSSAPVGCSDPVPRPLRRFAS